MLILFFFEEIFCSEHYNIDDVLKSQPFDTLLLFGNGFDQNLPMEIPRILTNRSESKNFGSKYNKNVVSVVNFENLDMLETFSEFLGDNMYSKVLILSASKVTKTEIFEKCFKVRLLNVVILEISQKPTTYLPFTEDLKTQKVELSNVFNNYFQDFNGFKVKLGGSLFKYMMSFANAESVFKEVLHTVETKYNFKLLYPFDDPDIYLSLHYTENVVRAGEFSSFFEYENIDIIIPIKNSVARYLYFVKPFNWKVWLTVCVGLIYNSLVLNFSMKYFDRAQEFSTSFLECLQMILWQGMNVKKHHWTLITIYLVMMIEGFVLVNLYLIYLGSFLVVDVKAQDFEICTVAKPEVLAREFNDVGMIKFKLMEPFEYGMKLLMLNMDYGYMVNKLVWSNSVLRRYFKIIRKEIRRPLPIRAVYKKNFMLRDTVNHFLLMEYSHGIYQKWLNGFIEIKPPETLDWKSGDFLVLNDFKIVLSLFFFGMGLASVIFAVELIHVKVIKKSNLL